MPTCPSCDYLLHDLDTECPRCGRAREGTPSRAVGGYKPLARDARPSEETPERHTFMDYLRAVRHLRAAWVSLIFAILVSFPIWWSVRSVFTGESLRYTRDVGKPGSYGGLDMQVPGTDGGQEAEVGSGPWWSVTLRYLLMFVAFVIMIIIEWRRAVHTGVGFSLSEVFSRHEERWS